MKKVSIAPKSARYEVVDKEKLIAAGLPTEFEALSIGTEDGQIAFVPLDESSRENAELIVYLLNNQEEVLKMMKVLQEVAPLLLKIGDIVQRERFEAFHAGYQSNKTERTHTHNFVQWGQAVGMQKCSICHELRPILEGKS